MGYSGEQVNPEYPPKNGNYPEGWLRAVGKMVLRTDPHKRFSLVAEKYPVEETQPVILAEC